MSQKLNLTFDIDDRIKLTDEERKEYKSMILCALGRWLDMCDTEDQVRIDSIKDFNEE